MRAWRERLGLNQVDLATRVGLDQSKISRLERGERGVSAVELGLLCKALELTDDERLDALRLAAEIAGAGPDSADARGAA